MGFAGTTKGSFFQSPDWVDTKITPGENTNEGYLTSDWIYSLLPHSIVLFSPNTVWSLIALVVYFVFPYDFNAAKTIQMDWVLFRLAVNTSVVFGYAGFWHGTLYLLRWGKRPFNPTRVYKMGKVLHNMWYTFLGVAQWTVWEALWMYCYATGRIPYISDAKLGQDTWATVNFVLSIWLVPVYREFHFYLCHRFIHIRCLYTYVHSLHHRNTDIEPFAGLSMHPIEHLYYFSCAFPALYFFCTPFAFHYNGWHLLLSPAASHSGFEDHFQSDQYHYLHHRYFECNYGTPGIPYDRWFGTYRDVMSGSKTYKGASEEINKKRASALDAKANLGMPDKDTFLYYCLLVPIVALFYNAVFQDSVSVAQAGNVAMAVAVGPILAGAAMICMTKSYLLSDGARKAFLYPFHKEPLLGAFGINCLLSVLVNVVPVYHTVFTILAEPGNGVWFQLHGK